MPDRLARMLVSVSHVLAILMVIAAVATLTLSLTHCTPRGQQIGVTSLNTAGIALRQAHWEFVSQCIDEHPEDLGRECEAMVNRQWEAVWVAYDIAAEAVDDPRRFAETYCALARAAPVALPAAEVCR